MQKSRDYRLIFRNFTMLADFFTLNYTYCLIALISVLFLIFRARRPSSGAKYPPGPKGWPLLGYLPFITGQQDVIMEKLEKEFGDVVMFPCGSENVVVFNTLEGIKESFIRQGDNFAGSRNNFKVFDYGMNFRGMFCEEGIKYKEQRKFILNTLKEFGIGKISLDNNILLECDALVKEVKKIGVKPFNATPLLGKTVVNILHGYINGERYEYDNPKLDAVTNLFERVDINFSKTYAVDYFEFAQKYLPPSLNGTKIVDELKTEMDAYLNEVIEHHKKTFDEGNIRDFTDAYLQQMRHQGQNNYDLMSLSSNMLAIFMAGTVSTSMTMSWTLKLLVDYPRVQERVADEIKRVIGHERHPSWMDRPSMPYTEATLHEVQRYADLIPIGVPHTNIEKANVLGFDIPKRSYVFGNFKKLHSDPKIWGDPENFRPERFIDGASGKIINTDNLFVFGVGRRRCVGEALARMNMFHILITLLQNFTFHPVEGVKDQGLTGGLVRYLLSYEVVAKPIK